MIRTSLAESGLPITSDEVTRLFEPFVLRHCAPGDPEWDAEIARRKRKIQRRYRNRRLLGWLPGWQRRRPTVLREYARGWSRSRYADYDPAGKPPRPSLWEWGGEHLLASDVGASRVRQLLIARLLELLTPRRVLEVGCGNGIHAMLLAGRLPDLQFVAVDLTRAGPHAARGLQREPVLPDALQEFAPLPLKDPSAFRRVRFVQADAARLPLSDRSFDLVYSVLALEQMERIRASALAEISRVSARHVLLIEPFAELNAQGWQKRYVVARNYFRGCIDDLPRYGLVPRLALDEFPQEVFLKVCAVLAERRA